MTAPIFTSALYDFLAELAQNNDKGWFDAHKKRYESAVKGPLLTFIRAFGEPLAAMHPGFVADARPVGGSLFRIHRDVRFSKDKSPYKTHAAAHFRHRTGKDVHAPGLYLHIEPGASMLGVGLWQPEPEPLRLVRTAIVERSAAWGGAMAHPGFRPPWRIEGESLKRPPQGFPADHPFAEDLRRKDFIAACPVEEAVIFGPNVVRDVADLFRRALPYVQFQLDALGLKDGVSS